MIKVVKKGDSTKKFLQGLSDLSHQVVEIGHYDDQGLHSDTDLTYPDLLRIWSVGMAHGHEGIVKRPLEAFTVGQLQSGKFENSWEFKQAINNWYKSLDKGTAANLFAEAIGQAGENRYKDVFGIIGPFMPTDADGTPMYETGELAEATTHRVKRK